MRAVRLHLIWWSDDDPDDGIITERASPQRAIHATPPAEAAGGRALGERPSSDSLRQVLRLVFFNLGLDAFERPCHVANVAPTSGFTQESERTQQQRFGSPK